MPYPLKSVIKRHLGPTLRYSEAIDSSDAEKAGLTSDEEILGQYKSSAPNGVFIVFTDRRIVIINDASHISVPLADIRGFDFGKDLKKHNLVGVDLITRTGRIFLHAPDGFGPGLRYKDAASLAQLILAIARHNGANQ